MDEITAEEIAHHYSGMGHSVTLINDIIAGTAMEDYEDAEKQDCVDRNVRHLEIVLARDYWTDEDMTEINAAIAAGTAYKAK